MYKRHMLVEISREGRERILNNLCVTQRDNKFYQSLLLPDENQDEQRYLSQPYFDSIPAIVRRKDERTPTGTVAIAFSSWQRNEQGRIKIADYADDNEIINVITPYDVTQIVIEHAQVYTSNRVMKTLKNLILQHQNDVKIGIWGSTALEIVTGYHYIHDDSDLDIILSFTHFTNNNINKLHFLLDNIHAIEKENNLRIDPEVDLSNGYGISLKELCSDSKTLLGKSINDISLLSRESVYLDLNI